MYLDGLFQFLRRKLHGVLAMTNKTMRFALASLAGVTAIVTAVVSYNYSVAAKAAAEISVKPFVMQQTLLNFTKNPSGDVLEQRILLRRQDSSEALIGTQFSQRGPITLRRVDWADGRSALLVDLIHARMSGFRPQLSIARRKERLFNFPANCVFQGESKAGEETLSGKLAYRVERQIAPDDRSTEWRLPDYECQAIQMVREKLQDGGWTKSFEARLDLFQEVDPDPNVFENWSVYEELRPSDLRARLYQSMGVTPEACPKCFEKGSAELDAKYEHAQTLQ